MAHRTHEMAIEDLFPKVPVNGTGLLVPITCWTEMFRETEITGVEFEDFWYDRVYEGVACFFSWLGEPRSTVLVVYDDEGPTYIERMQKAR